VGDYIPAVKTLADKAHVNTGMIAVSVLFVIGIIAMVFQGWNILLVSSTLIYPAIKSIQAIDSD
jgi:hypothetical protein